MAGRLNYIDHLRVFCVFIAGYFIPVSLERKGVTRNQKYSKNGNGSTVKLGTRLQ